MFDAVVVTLGVESVANRAALVVRLKEHAPVHCSLTSSLSQASPGGEEGGEGGKRASGADAKGKGGASAGGHHAAKRNKNA
jgi:hypothetical protein